jgi:hypothetical protein
VPGGGDSAASTVAGRYVTLSGMEIDSGAGSTATTRFACFDRYSVQPVSRLVSHYKRRQTPAMREAFDTELLFFFWYTLNFGVYLQD